MSVRIIGTGSALPGRHVSNEELAGIVDTSDEWIRERTGIGGRYVSAGETVASLAAGACSRALEDAGRTGEEVELLLIATCTPEDALPCMACQVQERIGAVNAVAFDLNAACAGFLFALHTAWAYMEAGICRNALIAGAEVLSKIVDWEDRGTCILFGDGAGAVYLEKCEGDRQGGILGFAQHSDGRRGSVLSCAGRQIHTPFFCQPPASGQEPGADPESRSGQDSLAARHPLPGYVQMDGREVFAFAVRRVPEVIREALEKAGVALEEVDLFVLHQANRRIIEGIAKRLAVGMERFPMNLDRVGNTSSAAIPLLLDELRREGRIVPGMTVVLSGFGAGLTYGACVLRW